MLIRCVDPDSHPEGTVPGLQLARTIAATGQSCPFGETVDVPDEVAGRPPSGTPGTKGYDPGEGLLAQTDVWQSAAGPAQAGEPPRSGAGSGREAWAAYAATHGVEVTESMSRDDLVAAVEATKEGN